MLIEINEGGQHASINPDHIVRAVSSAGKGGWLAVVTLTGSPGSDAGFDTVFGPFEGKADADDIVRRVTEAANEAQAAERESEFVEFVNRHMTRAAVRRDLVQGVEVVPASPGGGLSVKAIVGGNPIYSQSFGSKAEADELFDRLTR